MDKKKRKSLEWRKSDFLRFAQDANSLTAKVASRLSVSSERFIDWRWQMRQQIASACEFEKLIVLTAEERQGIELAGQLFKNAVTPYYAGLFMDSHADHPVRLQAIANSKELDNIMGENDPLREVASSTVKEVVHIYPDRVAFCVAMLCPVYCRYCYRKRRDDEEGLHFNRKIVEAGIAYIRSKPAIRDVLITGGDPFIASDEALDKLLAEIYSIEHVKIIRFGTRTPVTLPYRITRKLCSILAKYHPIWVNTHFNCAEELTPEACQALANLSDFGIPVGNQTVLLRGVNDSAEKMTALCQKLVENRVRPYYLFHPHRIVGTDHFQVSIREGQNIIRKLRGNISGFAIPSYILDTASGKVPINPNYILGEDGADLILENIRGEIHREPQVFRMF